MSDYLKLPIKKRKALLEKWNLAYRTGEAEVSDEVYDAVLESLPAKEQIVNQVGFEVSDSRKEKLPFPMYSMDKTKSLEEIEKWMKSKKIEKDQKFVITPKYDGLSFLVEYPSFKAYTRGNGIDGQRSDQHFAELMKSKKIPKVKELEGDYIIGEVIMPRAIFKSNYSDKFKNPRNFVAGLFNGKTIEPALQDVDFLAYGLGEDETDKLHSLKLLNKFNSKKVPFKECTINDLTNELLENLYVDWNKEYEIDGLIIELNSIDIREKLGREKNNNPAFARAWKGFREKRAQSTIRNHTFHISKEGRLTIVGQVDPVELDGVTVSNVTMYNAETVKSEGWGVGAEVFIIRSGMVIPKIIETTKSVEAELPKKCPSCGSKLEWDKNHIHLVCLNEEGCEEQRLEKIIAFLEILGIEEVGEGVVKQLYNAGFDTIEKILKIEQEEMVGIEGFAKRKAEIVYKNIRSKLNDIPLEKLQHATGIFHGLGTKKLALVNEYNSPDMQLVLEKLNEIEGFSEISSQSFIDGYDKFWKFIRNLPVTIASPKEKKGALCAEMKVCFTGYRDKEIEAAIEEQAGKIVSGISKNTTHLITKDKNSTSSKIQKARDLGVTIWEPEEISDFLAGS